MSNWKDEIAEKGIGCKTEFRSGWEDKEEYIICGKNGYCTSCQLKREDRLKILNLAEEHFRLESMTITNYRRLSQGRQRLVEQQEKEISRLKAEKCEICGNRKPIVCDNCTIETGVLASKQERQAMIAKIEKLISIYLSCRDCYHCPDSCKEEFGEMFKELKKEAKP